MWSIHSPGGTSLLYATPRRTTLLSKETNLLSFPLANRSSLHPNSSTKTASLCDLPPNPWAIPVAPTPAPPAAQPSQLPSPSLNNLHHHHHSPPNSPTIATSSPPQYPNPLPYYQYSAYYPPPRDADPSTGTVRSPPPLTSSSPPPPPGVGCRGEVSLCSVVVGADAICGAPEGCTIRNDVNLKKEMLRVEPDEQEPGKFLVSFTFDATIARRITVIFFAKEGFDCNLTSVKDNILEPVELSFNEGLGQKFRQSSGTGIDFSMFEEQELIKEGEEVYPLAIKAEASPTTEQEATDENQKIGTPNSQITLAIFEKKEHGKYQVRVVKQILWVNGTRYELQEIYGIGNSVDGDFNGNDPGKECVICLSEPRDTTVLPCRHMCMCSGCAKVLRFQTDRCPICRQPVERLLEIKVNNRGEEP